jgi:UDP-N-acetylmuramoyl-tripeptide--D-alanyl-D-alanine ligase
MSDVKILLKDLFDLPGAEIVNPVKYEPVSSVVTDSRVDFSKNKNSLFTAIKGERFDGHDFVREVVKKGASAILIDRKKYSEFSDLNVPLILVKDTTRAFGSLANVWRKKLKAKVVSLTGSAGKTTTKDMIAALLAEKYKVNKTVLNNNNHIGVPLTIFSTNRNNEVLVLEHGTNHFGEIAYTAEIAKPDYALITNIGHSHLKFLKNKKGVLKEKISLFDVTTSGKGTLFINKDDELLKNVYKNYKSRITFGYNPKADVCGKILSYSDDGKPVIELKYNGNKIKAEFSLYGEQNFRNFISAAAVAGRFGLSRNEIINGMKKFASPDKRLNVKKYKSFVLVDDTYNANPESMKASIELLNKINLFKNKVAFLGDMFELGKDELRFHKSLAGVIKENKIDPVYLIGKRMKVLFKELNKAGLNCKHFSTREHLASFIKENDFSNSVILVKGSRGMKMEEFVTLLVKDKSN